MEQKEWTIMIYMAGDNNLAVDMAYAMGQLKEFARQDAAELNLFVYFDGNSPDIPTLYCDFSESEPKYYRSHMLRKEKLFTRVPAKINENAADKKSILNFVDWCVNKVEHEGAEGKKEKGRRAHRYAFIISGHSLGFLDKGLFRDETSGRSMKLWDLYLAIKRLTLSKAELAGYPVEDPWRAEELLLDENADEILGQELDILGFDSCVMGMFEVGYQFIDCAKTMIVSEGSIPSAGWTYAKLLRNLCRHSANYSTETLAARLVEEFIKSQSEFVIGGVSVDLAAWRMCDFEELQLAINQLSEALLQCFEKNNPLYLPMERAILKVHWKCQSYMYDQNVDLGDFCELLDQECDAVATEMGGDQAGSLNKLQNACRKVVKELQQAVIQSGFCGGSYQYSNGVSVFFPWSLEAYEAAKPNFKNLWVSRVTRRRNEDAREKTFSWGDFLEKYLKEVSRRRVEDFTPQGPGKKVRKPTGPIFHDQSPVNPQDSNKQAGLEGNKQAGLEGNKQAGLEGNKQAGLEGNKQAGLEGNKQAGLEGNKQAGLEGNKLGGEGANALFDSLRMWKNTETRRDIYGFTNPEREFDYGSADPPEEKS